MFKLGSTVVLLVAFSAVVLGRHDGEGRLGRRGGKIKSGKNGLAYLGALGASTFGGFDSSYHHGPTFSVYPSNYLHGGYAPSYGSYGHHGHKDGGFEQPKVRSVPTPQQSSSISHFS